MKGKILMGGLAAVLALASGSGVFLWMSWQRTEIDTQVGAQAIENLMQVNQDINEQISTSESNHASLSTDYAFLELEKDQAVQDKSVVQARADLYQSQKDYLESVLDWYGWQYDYEDAKAVVDAYAAASGNVKP